MHKSATAKPHQIYSNLAIQRWKWSMGFTNRVQRLAMRRFNSRKLTSRSCRIMYRRAFLIFGLCSFLLYAALEWILFLPTPQPDLLPPLPCQDDEKGYVLEEMGICTDTCDKLCFPRVHGICFGHSQVTVCEEQPPIPQDIKTASGEIPTEMRFYMEKPRMKIPVKRGACLGWNSSAAKPSEGEESGGEVQWIRELQMVADLTLMPTGRVGPNPHHEAEKIVPAILFSHLYGLKNSSLFWFADPNDPLMISTWSLGLLEVFSKYMKIQYLKPVAKNQAPICFEDVILFTGLTNSAYMPNPAAHDWIRGRILEYCQVPSREAKSPVEDVVIINRPNSSRNIANYEAVKEVIERKLQVPVKMAVLGPWDFCEQVRLVAEADFLLTPHGSHNANLLTVRPGAVVMEVFPFLYHTDWYGHYLHAARVSHHEILGTWPSESSGMPFLMRLYALLYGWQKCFFVRHCMNYGKSQKIYVDLHQLESLMHHLIGKCSIVVRHSACKHGSPQRSMSSSGFIMKGFIQGRIDDGRKWSREVEGDMEGRKDGKRRMAA